MCVCVRERKTLLLEAGSLVREKIFSLGLTCSAALNSTYFGRLVPLGLLLISEVTQARREPHLG